MTALKSIVMALEFAAKKHRDQRRKDHAASPYINHPIALVSILVNEANVYDAETLVAAILHDTVEDTDTTPEEIEQHFGIAVRMLVAEVTDDRRLNRSERKAQQILHAPNLSTKAALVKIADKVANLRDLIAAPPLKWSPQRTLDYFDWAQEVVLNIRNPHPELLRIFKTTVAQKIQAKS